MPHYFFDICDQKGRIPDEEGTDCADMEAALAEAKASARDLVKQYIDTDWPLARRWIEIRNEDQVIVSRIPLLTVIGNPH